MNGRRVLGACAAVILLAAVTCAVNALSILHEAAREGRDVPGWQPWATEYTSLAGLVVALSIAVAAEHFARAARNRATAIAILLGGSLAFSFVHVVTMVALREGLWWSLGRDYSFDFAGDWLYEYRKDVIAYGLTLLFLTLGRRLAPDRPAEVPDSEAEGPALVALSDGRRNVQVEPAELRALRAGGNYVELIFADGRRTLIRTTLAAAGAALAGHGFRRTHKSWLVRVASVTALRPSGAGDFRVRLDGGLEAPLSRHNRAVLEEVRAAVGTGKSRDLTATAAA